MTEIYTMYEWCLLYNIRPNIRLNLEDFIDDDFMTREVTTKEFLEFYDNKRNYKKDSTPRKPIKYLELRMYRLVPYNISDIQKGIQIDHAKDDYYNQYFHDEECFLFRTQWFTTIALNGGTSNEGHMVKQGFKETFYVGTMQKHLEALKDNLVKVGVFYEPDLNSMLTAINFIVDERVFLRDLYPDFKASPTPCLDDLSEVESEAVIAKHFKDSEKQYASWLDKIGGPKNAFLRTFLKDKKLA